MNETPSMSWPRRIGVAVFVLVVVAIVAASLKPRAETPVAVQASPVRRGAITRSVTAAGKLQPATTVKVSSNLSGDLLDLRVKEGDRVEKGQLLARIDARRFAAQVRQQEASRASAAAQLGIQTAELARFTAERDRVRRLVDSNSASQAELERAEADIATQQARIQESKQHIAQADAALTEANHMLSMTTLYAPMDGVVTTLSRQVGERVRGSDFAEDVILVIATLNSMEVKVEVGEHEVVYLKEGNHADIEIDAFPEKRFPATVVEIARNANVKNPGTEAEVTTFPVRLSLDVPVAGALPGMSAEATVSTETHQDALVVPIQAVATRTEKELSNAPANHGEGAPELAVAVTGAKKAAKDPVQKVVFVVEAGKAKARRVEIGLASENEIEIVQGLKGDEQVVDGPYKAIARELQDGKPVRIDDKADGGAAGTRT